ncbi:MAG TPA: aldo/keto reductase [Aliidongia sp.]|nr:aldo/keto reductase [Aliidongia sp.]
MTELAPGLPVPAIGQGTWGMGERSDRKEQEVAALRAGIERGLTLIDTAEMYGEGGAEEVVGQAIAGRRDEIVLVSKFYPQNATRQGGVRACERSLRRLGTDRLDLYLLHWRGSVPFAETIAALEGLVEQGKIRHYGVSNLDAGDMAEWHAEGGRAASDQILYNPMRRGPEFDLLPWCRAHQVSIMAYSPLEQGRLLGDPALSMIARRHDATPAAVALAWLARQEGVIAIPKAVSAAHIGENCRALGLDLTSEDLAEIDGAFPPPKRKTPLAML